MNILDGDTNNNEEKKPNPDSSSGENTTTPPASNDNEQATSRNPVKKLEFEVDTSKKPEVIKEPTKILQGEEVSAFISQPTEGDLKKQQEQQPKPQPTEEELKKLRDTNTTQPKVEPPLDPTKRRKKAEKYAKLLDLAIVQGLKFWSGQADDTGLKTPDGDLTVMADAIEDIMIENNYTGTNSWFEGAGSLGAVYAGHFKQAQKSRKVIQDFKKTEAYKKAKEEEAKRQLELKERKLDAFKGTYQKKKGGQRKA